MYRMGTLSNFGGSAPTSSATPRGSRRGVPHGDTKRFWRVADRVALTPIGSVPVSRMETLSDFQGSAPGTESVQVHLADLGGKAPRMADIPRRPAAL